MALLRRTLVVLLVPSAVVCQVPQRPNELSAEARSACDAAYAAAAGTPGVTIERRTGTFVDETLVGPVFGCGMAISGSFARAEATGDAAVRLRRDFESRGWPEMGAYSADGTDGTSFAFQGAGVACLVRGTWDGGAADDPSIPPLDAYEVVAFCTSPPFPESRPF